MKRRIRFDKLPKLLRRMFWRNYLVFTMLAFLLVSGFSACLLYDTVQKENHEVMQTTANLAQTIDQWLTASQRLSVNVGQIEKLQDMAAGASTKMNFSELDAVLLSQAQHSLVAAGAMDPRIAHLAVYFYNHEYVITDTRTLGLDEFYQTLFATPAVPQSEYLRHLPVGKFLFIREGAVGNTTPVSPVFVTSVIDTHGKQYGNLFVFWDSRRMADALAEIAGEHIYYFIYDAGGDPMFCSDSRFLSQDKMLTQLEEAGEDPVNLSISTFSGWSICAGRPRAFLYRRLRYLLFLMAAVLGGTLFVGWFVTLALCKKNYAPISELARAISAQTPGGLSQEMEYEALVAVISSITDSKKVLEEQIEVYKPFFINSLLLELLDGAQEKPVILNTLHAMGCPLPYRLWQCTAAMGDGFRHDVVMALTETLLQEADQFVCYAITYDRRSCVFLLNAATEDAAQAAMRRLRQILEQAPAVRAYGTSDAVGTANLLGGAYHRAQEALGYAALDSRGKGSDWQALADSGVFALRQPDILNHLFVTFSVGRIAEAKSRIQEYFSQIIYNGYARKEYLRALDNVMLSCITRLETEYDLSFPYEPLQQWNADDPDSIRTLYGAALAVCDSIYAAMDERERTMQREPTVLTYLNDHLFDENLSLTLLAETFGVSESVISRKIRAVTGCNFLDYVNKRRIEHSAILLLQTDVSVNDLAKAVGYGSDITFRRLFKKYMGVTPGEYRHGNTK